MKKQLYKNTKLIPSFISMHPRCNLYLAYNDIHIFRFWPSLQCELTVARFGFAFWLHFKIHCCTWDYSPFAGPGFCRFNCQADGLLLIKASLSTNKHRKILYNCSKETLSRNVVVYPDATLNVFFHKNYIFHYRRTVAKIVSTFFSILKMSV